MTRLTGLKIAVLVVSVLKYVSAMEMGITADAPAKEITEPSRTPISMCIVYHHESEGYGEFVDIKIDNGAAPATLLDVIVKKVPVILVNGVVAYPLLTTTLTGYLQTKGLPLPDQLHKLPPVESLSDYHRNSTAEILEKIKSNVAMSFLTEYTPYLIKKPLSDVAKPLSGGPDESEKYTDERFVLFVRNDATFKLGQAFNAVLLEKIDLSEPGTVEKTLALLDKIKEHKKNFNVIARLISSIFNTTQQRYSWDIALMGHGSQMTKLETPLLVRRGAVEVKGVEPVKEVGIDRAEAKFKTKTEPAIEQEGLIANMPPRQVGVLLNSFISLPINILLLVTCYGGGYNAALMEQQLEMLQDLTDVTKRQISLTKMGPKLAEKKSKNVPLTEDEQAILDGYNIRFSESHDEKEGAALFHAIQAIKKMNERVQQRKFILVSQAAFDATTVTGDLGQWLKKFDELFNQTPRPTDVDLKERIKDILWRECKDSPIILMPTSKEFELLTKSECLEKLSNAMAANQKTSPRSINLLVAAKEVTAFGLEREDMVVNLFKQALEKNNWSLVLKMIQEYPDKSARFGYVNIKDGKTALIRAVEEREYDVVEKILTGVNVRDDKGKSALIYAIENGNKAMIVLLLAKEGIQVNDSDTFRDRKTALMCAVEKGDEDIVALLLAKEGIQVNDFDKDRKTALMHAVEKGRPDIVEKFLVVKDIDINLMDYNGKSALIYAIEKGNKDIASLLLAKENIKVDEPDKEGKTPLIYAIESGNYEIVDMLLKKGANIKDKQGKTVLIHAVEKGDKGIVLLLLAKENIKVDEPDKERKTPLIYAIENGREDIVEALLTKTSANMVNSSIKGAPALMWAVNGGNQKIVKLLLAKEGIKVNEPDSFDKKTPLIYAIEKRDKDILRLLFAKKDIDVNKPDQQGKTPLMYAVESGVLNSIESLLKMGASIDAKDADGKTALMYVVQSANPDIVEKLLVKDDKANIDAKDRDGRTALMYAAQSANPDVVEKLLAKVDKANIDAKDRDGRTALMYAAQSANPDVVEKLLAKADKANIDAKDRYDQTALMHAAGSGSPAVGEMLKKAVALTDSERNNVLKFIQAIRDGDLPLVQAMVREHPDKAEQFINEKTESKKTALMLALEKDLMAVDELLAAGARIDVKNKSGQTPFMYAAGLNLQKVRSFDSKQKATLNMTLDKLFGNIDKDTIDEKDANGWTVLMYAVAMDNADMVKKLLANGADIYIKNKKNFTVLDLASGSGPEIKEMIAIAVAKYGAKAVPLS